MASHAGYKSEEISVFDLIADMLSHWKIIIAVFVIVTGLVGAYLFYNPPLVVAKASILPPTESQIADYNFGRTKNTEFSPYDVNSVYSVFVEALQSEQLHRRFFTELYLPSLPTDLRDPESDSLYLKALKSITLTGDGKLSGGRLVLEISNRDRAVAKVWLDNYISWAKTAAEQQMAANVNREAEVRAAGYQAQITDLKSNAQTEKTGKVTRLQEALTVAKAVGLESPPVFTSGPVSEVSLDMNGDLAYMRGAKALTAELTNLNERKSEDAFIKELRELELRYDLYQSIATKQRDVDTFRIDGGVHVSPQADMSRRKMMLLLCAILSLCLGMMVATGFAAYKRRWLGQQ